MIDKLKFVGLIIYAIKVIVMCYYITKPESEKELNLDWQDDLMPDSDEDQRQDQ